MSLRLPALRALSFLGLLFVVAVQVEQYGELPRRLTRLRHFAYTLSLGVYCTSWTFYGSVGGPVRDGRTEA